MTSLTRLRIQALIEANLFSAHAYWEAAQIVSDKQLQMQLRAWARERTLQAKQLRRSLTKSAQIREADEIEELLNNLSDASSTTALEEAHSAKELFYEAAGNETCLRRMYEKLLADPDVLTMRKQLNQHYAQIRAVSFNVQRLCS